MAQDITGMRFGKLVVLGPNGHDKHRNALWKCRCDCGGETTVQAGSLRHSITKSCGCLPRGSAPTHAMSGTPEYFAWGNMIQRCTNPKFIHFDRYGGRGIQVCSRWRSSFEAFYADMGPRPGPTHSVERRNVDGHYEPGNCYWATADIQASNTSRNVFYEIDGERLTQSQLARKYGIGIQTLRTRLERGLPLKEALTKPLRGK